MGQTGAGAVDCRTTRLGASTTSSTSSRSTRPSIMSRSRFADAVAPHELFVDRRAERAVGHPLVDDADDRAMAQLPEVLEGEQGPALVVDVHARPTARSDAIADADDVLVMSGEIVEGCITP